MPSSIGNAEALGASHERASSGFGKIAPSRPRFPVRTKYHQRMVASVERNGIGFTRKFKRKTSFTLFEMRLKILRLTVLFSTNSMHGSNTSVLMRMFFSIVPSDRRFLDVIVDTSRETTLAERTRPAAFSSSGTAAEASTWSATLARTEKILGVWTPG
jgi:hypothetical protein